MLYIFCVFICYIPKYRLFSIFQIPIFWFDIEVKHCSQGLDKCRKDQHNF